MKASSRLLAVAALAVIAVLPSGCDKSDPTAPDQSTVVVDASPTNLVLDTGEVGRSNITATVLDHDGAPVSGIVVHFTTNSGTLRSNGGGVKTNSNGEASDVLTLHDDDEDATVTARASGATSDTVGVTITAPGQNIAPTGTITSPATNQSIAPTGNVNFQGSGIDADGNTPLTFLWTFGTGGPANSTVEDPGNVTFPTVGIFTVTFTVTDSLGLADATPDTRVITVATNQAPNGTIDLPAGDTSIAAGGLVHFTGTGTDADGDTPLTFLWTFGAGGPANSNAEDPGDVTFPTAGTYTVTFTVTDSRGAPDATPDTVVITVN